MMETPIHAASGNAAEFAWRHDDVFGRIAGRYDLLCDVFSFGIHRRHHGFQDVAFERLSLGIVAIHIARKPM